MSRNNSGVVVRNHPIPNNATHRPKAGSGAGAEAKDGDGDGGDAAEAKDGDGDGGDAAAAAALSSSPVLYLYLSSTKRDRQYEYACADNFAEWPTACVSGKEVRERERERGRDSSRPFRFSGARGAK
ncbi:uncharacterized protein HMPREF1120_06630 [Exophiala dermatitidis NIH/UT8656]|uniref:Uncharacterized protein n=1 Tax=Exophiala dermatitidis (strain ATCC 34100 / CBS 525.76 / NIH/UT8656) TaxID=858893 RepID=H6C1T8_EXODN|nr:uncharacterized protein HMPREF1120_06630 [Exophiala dermatitidis NIH/UT8656]EHY58625.1 hypothetical protein HMPREF1120_06630 [Exophiala dermatitidis NIH/UT8656]